MSDSHLERIADLLPDEQREHWFRISSQLPNANKNSTDELWLLAELIAMVGLTTREQCGGGRAELPEQVSVKTRDVAEKERQTAATLERLVKSVAKSKTVPKASFGIVMPVCLILLILSQVALGWVLWNLVEALGLELWPK